jgi:hypothetical protein
VEISAIALQGLERAQSGFEQSAARLATPATAAANAQSADIVSLSKEAVTMLVSRNEFSANLQVLKTAAEMEREALNLLG